MASVLVSCIEEGVASMSVSYSKGGVAFISFGKGVCGLYYLSVTVREVWPTSGVTSVLVSVKKVWPLNMLACQTLYD